MLKKSIYAKMYAGISSQALDGLLRVNYLSARRTGDGGEGKHRLKELPLKHQLPLKHHSAEGAAVGGEIRVLVLRSANSNTKNP